MALCRREMTPSNSALRSSDKAGPLGISRGAGYLLMMLLQMLLVVVVVAVEVGSCLGDVSECLVGEDSCNLKIEFEYINMEPCYDRNILKIKNIFNFILHLFNWYTQIWRQWKYVKNKNKRNEYINQTISPSINH